MRSVSGTVRLGRGRGRLWSSLAAAVVATVIVLVASVLTVIGPPHPVAGVHDDSMTAPLPAAHVPVPSSTLNYVALGSSYAAGLDSSDQVSGRCMRNDDDYPHQAAATATMSLTDVTCSGSTIPDILYRAQPGRADAPQIDAVTADTDVVTITTGGNDVRYIGGLTAMSCANWLALPGHGESHPCRPGRPGKPPSADAFASIERGLVSIVEAVHARAPHAVVILVSYLPVLAADAGTCPTVPLSAGEAATTVATFDRLTDATRAAALSTGTVYVDAASAGAGHTACSSSPWVYGFKMPAPYHPDADGRAAMARLTVEAFEDNGLAGSSGRGPKEMRTRSDR